MIEIVNVEDREDGGAIFTVEMDPETVVLFAKVGLIKTLVDMAKQIVEEEDSTQLIYPPGYDPNDEIECRTNNAAMMCEGCSCWKNQNE